MSFSPPSRQSAILAILLLCAIGIFYGAPSERPGKLANPLARLNLNLPDWQVSSEGTVDKETESVLRADDTLVREYVNRVNQQHFSLFIAFFGSQTTGAAPHSPKNCLPGAGWVVSESDIIHIPVPDEQPIPVNRYVISKEEVRAVVLYWYQSRNRAVASEYWAKAFLVYDSIRSHRSDTSIIRVVVPVAGDEQKAEATAVSLVQSIYRPIREFLP